MESPQNIDSSAALRTPDEQTATTRSRPRLVLAFIVVAFVVTRLPTVLLAPGGQDEEWYGVAGLTIAQDGIPRVPYSRATSPESVFLGAEEMLFAQPPLSFYLQAPFFAVLPGTYGTARLASLVAGCFSMVLTYAIGQVLFRDSRISLLGSGLYSFSRLCFFPAMLARPDMLCGTLGLLAVYCVATWHRHLRTRWLVASGVAVGFAALAHPFAIVFAIQIAVWVCLVNGQLRIRLERITIFSAAVTAAFSLWLPLIFMHPQLFRSQFVGNILRPAGPGLLSRFVFPMESFANQVPQLWERAHPIQFGMLVAALLIVGPIAIHRRDKSAVICWIMAFSSIYLLIVCLGIHPIQGFWCYSAALSWLCFAYVAFACYDSIPLWMHSRRAVQWIGIAVVLLAMVPGSGIRTVSTYAKRWHDTVYCSPCFVEQILADLPREATLTVGPEFSLNAYASGRDVILACRHPMYFDSAEFPTDYYVFGRRDLVENMTQAYSCELIKVYGNRDDVFANYAEVYRGKSPARKDSGRAVFESGPPSE